jgi:hypothetical protein
MDHASAFIQSLEKVNMSETSAAERSRECPKVSGLAAWSEKRKWYSSLPLGAVVSLFCESI